VIEFFAPGIPQTKGSARAFAFRRKKGPRAGKLGVSVQNDNPAEGEWRAVVALAGAGAMPPGFSYNAAPLSVQLLFKLPRPKSHYGARGLKERFRSAVPSTKPDVDKLIRSVLDALTGIIWRDDSQVIEIRARKEYVLLDPPAYQAGVLVRVEAAHV
jgi:Holliday junction resolvase RusA-like endonuclease